jgi:hypothetical protein
MKRNRFLGAMVIVLVACTRTEQSEQRTQPTFPSAVASMCSRLAAETAFTQEATNAAEFEERSRALLEEQEGFLEMARDLSPPTEIRRSFQAYLLAIEDIVSLNRRSLEGNQGRRQSLMIALEAAEAGVRALDAKEGADLPATCPPPSAEEAYAFLLVARGNVSCFNLGAELEKLGKLRTETDTREETAELFDLARGLAVSLASGLREAFPPELDDPTVERMIRLYEQRADALGELEEAFVERDRAAYDKAARKQAIAAREADQLAESLGLAECVGFLGIAAE